MTTVSKDAPQNDPARKSHSGQKSGRDQSPKSLPVWLKVFLSLLFVFHLLGVFIAPLNVSIGVAYDIHRPPQLPPDSPSSPSDPEAWSASPAAKPVSYDESEIVYLAQGVEGSELLAPPTPDENTLVSESEAEELEPLSLYEFYQPYLNLLYLNHGYGFFSPDPGPSHLIRYTIEHYDGTIIDGVFPNLRSKEHPLLYKETIADTQWPRLRYHRHFMLAEQMIEPNAIGPQSSLQTYAEYLLRIHHAKRVQVDHIEHLIPSPDQVRNGERLDAQESYIVLRTKMATAESKAPEGSAP